MFQISLRISVGIRCQPKTNKAAASIRKSAIHYRSQPIFDGFAKRGPPIKPFTAKIAKYAEKFLRSSLRALGVLGGKSL
jgi:hypothetical protein